MWRYSRRNSTLSSLRSSPHRHLVPLSAWSFPPRRHALGELSHIEMIMSRRSQGFVHPPDLKDLNNRLRRRSSSILDYYCPRLTFASKEQPVSVCTA